MLPLLSDLNVVKIEIEISGKFNINFFGMLTNTVAEIYKNLQN